MKEENKVLRQVVEQTMKDYHDLQMKFSFIKQNKQNNKVLNLSFLYKYVYPLIDMQCSLGCLALLICIGSPNLPLPPWQGQNS